WHRRGTRYGIRVDDDGLLRAGEPGVQLTWMDAKVGDWVVTPRIGKPVEIQALWVNALRVAARLEERSGASGASAALTAEADRAEASFLDRFWNEAAGYLYDVVDGYSRRSGSARSIRPTRRTGAATRAASPSATARTTRAPSGRGCSGRTSTRCSPCAARPARGRRPSSSKASNPSCDARASATSPRSTTATSRARPAAASRRPGAWGRWCG